MLATNGDDRRPRVLLLYDVEVGERMPAVGIRAYELAKALQPHAEVTLAAPESDTPPVTDVNLVRFPRHTPRSLAPHIAAADAIITQPPLPNVAALLRRFQGRLIFDIYDAATFATLEHVGGKPNLKDRLILSVSVDRPVDAFRLGHHFVCGSERQRDLWIGAMLAERLLQPQVYDRDPSLRSIIDVVPIGVPAEPPARSGEGGPRTRFPQIGPDDEIVLWNGGIWNWYDPLTAVRAFRLLSERRPAARLVFMSATNYPEAQRAAAETRDLASQLGLLDRVVFFNDEWVPYEQRANWLLDADCALLTHIEQLEARFSTRTRLLDCYWAGLPVVCTRGEEQAERIEREELGATAPGGDERALASALEVVLERGREHYSERLQRAAADHAWPVAAGPLIRHVTSPDIPPRLADGLGARLSKRPSQRLRGAAFRAARVGLNVIGRADGRTI